MRTSRILTALAVPVTLATGLALAAPADAATLAKGRATATGSQELGGGDSDGSGTFRWSVRNDQLCYRLRVRDLEPVVAAHIHAAPAGVNGPVVIPLTPPVTGRSRGCVAVAPALLADLAANPDGFYVNVHTVTFPGGAIRGQLS